MSKCSARFKTIMGIALTLLLGFNIFPYWWANYTDKGFGGGDAVMASMKTGIADGTGYFLESYTGTLAFMKKIELSERMGINIDELKTLLDNSIRNMESAQAAYTEVKQIADNTPYNPAALEYLARFDYDGFCIANSMNAEIFAPVKETLSTGNARKCFDRLLTDMGIISGLLNEVKTKLEAGTFPPVKETWRLNQAFTRLLLYGQYVSQVFGSM
jgi:hypothetical protein